MSSPPFLFLITLYPVSIHHPHPPRCHHLTSLFIHTSVTHLLVCEGPQTIRSLIWEQCSSKWNCCLTSKSYWAPKVDRIIAAHCSQIQERTENKEEVKVDVTFKVSVLQRRQFKLSFNAGFTNSQAWECSDSLHALYNTAYVLLLSSLCVTPVQGAFSFCSKSTNHDICPWGKPNCVILKRPSWECVCVCVFL